MKRFISLAWAVLMTLGVIGPWALTASVVRARPLAQAYAAYCISDIDASQWPKVTLQVRTVDGSGGFAPLTGMKLYEEQQEAADVAFTTVDGPLNLVVLIDGGRAPSKRVKDDILRALASISSSGAFKNGVDSIRVRQMYNATAPNTASPLTTPIKDWTTNPAEIAQFALTANLLASKGPTRGLEGLQDAIDDLKVRGESRGGNQDGATVKQAAVILFMTNRIEAHTGDAERDGRAWAGILGQAHIPVYALQTDLAARNQAPVRALTNSGGRYLPLSKGFETLLPAFYGSLANHRKFYSVTYTSTFNGAGARSVTLDAPGSRGVCTPSDSYTAAPGQPVVTLDLPVSVLNFSAEIQQTRIKATVDWRDNPKRGIETATLIVKAGSRAAQRIEGEVLTDGNVQFLVDEDNFAGVNRAVLSVEIVDDAKRTHPSQEQTMTIVHTALAGAPTTAVVPVADSGPSTALVVGLGLALVGISAGLGVLYVKQRRNGGRFSGTFSGNFSGGYRAATNGTLAQVMASLVVVDGPHGRVGEKIRLNKARYVIGREKADIMFYTNAPQSSLSRTHCTITRDSDMGFWIVDNGSVNGTSINGDRKQASERYALKNGDQILLGDLSRSGVLLEFRLDNPTGALRAGGQTANLR